jgi:hypothetical protein
MKNIKNKFKRIFNYQLSIVSCIITVILVLSFPSCDFLDVNDYFEDTMKYDSVFHNKRNIERYLWATAAVLPDESAILANNYTPGPFATDEGFTLLDENQFRGMSYTLGKVSASNTYGMDTWRINYIVIRKANTIIARMDEAADLTTLDKRELLGYTYFLRAYAYYHLAVKYGPVVILGDELMENNEDPGYYDRQRATFDESIDYICQELERAAEYLQPTTSVSYFGRPTKGAAYGLIARLRLIQASPLYNGQSAARTYFGDWTRTSDGVHYVSQQYDEKKWAVAAAAAKRIIDSDQYSLFTVTKMSDTWPLPDNVSTADFPDGVGNIDPLRSYSDMFTGEALSVRNPELLWARNSTIVRDNTYYALPPSQGGANGLGVTQKVVDAYLMADGNDKDHSSAQYPYSTTGTSPGKSLHGQYWLPPVNNMYHNREMRFYASIGYNGWQWPGNTGTPTWQYAYYYVDGNAGKMSNISAVNYPATGYVLKKYVHYDDSWLGSNAKRIDKVFPIIRYAEILLSYAEALNNLTTTHTVTDAQGNSYSLSRNTDEIKKAFDQVRYRAGLPGLTAAELNSPATMQALIERERMVEFLFEDRRYFDVRRWGIYEKTENEPIMGMNTNTTAAGYHTVIPVNHSTARNRVVDRRFVLFPINLEEVRKAPLLDQNPGYQK